MRGFPKVSRSRMSWAKLLNRVFRRDITECHFCRDEVNIIAAIPKKECCIEGKISSRFGAYNAQLPCEPALLTPQPGSSRKATFQSILEGIAKAKRWVLVQLYIVREDELGRRLKDALIKKAAQKVPVYFLYDEIGSPGLKQYVANLQKSGVEASAFNTTRGAGNRFQLNFRNHRKIVVVDGNYGRLFTREGLSG